MFYERLQQLCNEKGVKITNVVSELKISTGNLSKWKNGVQPKATTLSNLAAYFNVSTDYLLGNTDVKEPSASITFDDFTAAMHNQSKLLTDEQKQQLIKMAEFFAKDNAEG